MVFVDYEYWFYSYQTIFGIKPSPISFRKDLEKKYNISDIMVFGDFSRGPITGELAKIREITNAIIETQNTDSHRTKDMTDFIMLDYIYQTAADRKDIKTYVIFTGDGHFHSVAKYLSHKLKKKVVIYGVRGSVSKSLKSATEDVTELPGRYELSRDIVDAIVSNFEYVERHEEIVPTFKTTVTAVSRKSGIPEKDIQDVLRCLMEDGMVKETATKLASGNTVNVLSMDKNALTEAELIKKPTF